MNLAFSFALVVGSLLAASCQSAAEPKLAPAPPFTSAPPHSQCADKYQLCLRVVEKDYVFCLDHSDTDCERERTKWKKICLERFDTCNGVIDGQ